MFMNVTFLVGLLPECEEYWAVPSLIFGVRLTSDLRTLLVGKITQRRLMTRKQHLTSHIHIYVNSFIQYSGCGLLDNHKF